jgi:hypothetical protein
MKLRRNVLWLGLRYGLRKNKLDDWRPELGQDHRYAAVPGRDD